MAISFLKTFKKKEGLPRPVSETLPVFLFNNLKASFKRYSLIKVLGDLPVSIIILR